MPFQFTRTAIADVIVIDPQVIPDQRGFFMETYKRSDFTAVGISDVFVQCNHSKSAKGILRGCTIKCNKGAGQADSRAWWRDL
jgi:dTDP-4-dehydrorhamnose 3,5-epimerase